MSGGAPLGERLGHFFRGAGITVLEGYGLTETSAAAAVNRPGRNKIGTVGQPLPGVSLRIAEDGEILIKGPNVFPGYWQNPEATAEILDDEGWLRTGDLGELDDEGFLQVTGRKKEIIVTAGGKNVAPAVLEDRLRAHPLVSQCLVVGDGRPYIACLVTLDEEAPGALEAAARQAGQRHGGRPGHRPGPAGRDPGRGGRRQQGGVPGRVDPPVPGAARGLHRGQRPPDAVAEGPPRQWWSRTSRPRSTPSTASGDRRDRAEAARNR